MAWTATGIVATAFSSLACRKSATWGSNSPATETQETREEEEGGGQTGDVLRVAPLEKGGEREGSAGKFQERPPVGVKMTLHCAVPCHLWKTKQLLLPDEMRTLVSEGLFLLIGRRRNKKGPAAPA